MNDTEIADCHVVREESGIAIINKTTGKRTFYSYDKPEVEVIYL